MNESLSIANRSIRIFVSSTFIDMVEERIHLIKKVFPKLQKAAAERNVQLTWVDMRWGITEEQAKSGKLVNICLSEADNSVPFFLGILGARYGWVPAPGELDETTFDLFPDVKGFIEKGISVTEMEMRHGVLHRDTPMHAYFYINSCPDSRYYDDQLKTESLIETIRNNGRYSVKDYTTATSLGEMVERDFMQLLEDIFPVCGGDTFSTEQIFQDSQINQLSEIYVSSEDCYRVLDTFLIGQSNVLNITGNSGSGKSALLANWLKGKRQNREIAWLYFFANPLSDNSIESVIGFWYNQLKSYLSPEFDAAGLSIEQLIGYVAEKHQIVLILDGADSFLQSDNWEINTLKWIPGLPQGGKILISSQREITMCGAVTAEQHSEISFYRVSDLSSSQKKEIICRYINRYSKTLEDYRIKKIADAPLYSNALMLSLLLSELVHYGIFEKVDEFLDGYLSLDSETEFYRHMLDLAEKEFGQRVVRGGLTLIANSQYGLAEDDVIGALGITRMEWSPFYCYFLSQFSQKKGMLQIANSQLKEAVLDRYDEETSSYMALLSGHFGKQLEDRSYSSPYHVWDELINAYCCQNESDQVFNLLTQFPVLNYLAGKRARQMISLNGAKKIYDLFEDLISIDKKKYAIEHFALSDDSGLDDKEFLITYDNLFDVALHCHADWLCGWIALKLIDRYKNLKEDKEEYCKYLPSWLRIMSHRMPPMPIDDFSQNVGNLAAAISEGKDIGDEEWIERFRLVVHGHLLFTLEEAGATEQEIDSVSDYFAHYENYINDELGAEIESQQEREELLYKLIPFVEELTTFFFSEQAIDYCGIGLDIIEDLLDNTDLIIENGWIKMQVKLESLIAENYYEQEKYLEAICHNYNAIDHMSELDCGIIPRDPILFSQLSKIRKEMGIYSSSDAGRKFDADEYVSETQGDSFYGHIIRILADYHSQEGQESYAEIDTQESCRILETAEYDSYGSLMEELSMLE